MFKNKYTKAASSRSAKVNPVATVPFDPETESILRQLKEKASEIDRRAKHDGNQGIPAADQRSLCDSELEIKAKTEEGLRKSLTNISLLITNIESELATKKRLSEMFSSNPKAVLKDHNLQGYDPLIEELETMRVEANNKVKHHEEILERLRLELEKDKVEKNITEANIGYRPRRSWWSTALYLFFFLFATLTDISVTFKNIEATAKTPLIASLAVAIAIALILAYDAHHLGRSIKMRNRKGLMLSTILAGIVMVVVSLLAISYGSWITAMINLAMLVGLALVAYFHCEEKAGLVSKFFRDEAAIRVGERKIARVEKLIHGIRAKANAKKLKLLRDYQAEVVDEYHFLRERLAEWQDYRNRTKDVFVTVYRQHIARYRIENRKQRTERGFPQVAWWMESNNVPPLRISDNEEHNVVDVFIDSAPDNPAVIDKDVFRQIISNIYPLLLIGTLFLGSCQLFVPSNGVSAEVKVLPDGTDTLDFDPEATMKFISSALKFDTTKTYGTSVSIEVTLLNDRYANPTFATHLPEGGSAFFEITKDRLDQQGVFYRQTLTALKDGHRFTGELPHSRLYRPICEVLQELQHSTAKRKICLIFSDGLENTKDLSFYDYRQKPERLLEEKDMVMVELEKQCPLPNLTGIEIYLIHQPSLELDELGHYTKLFWKGYFESHGATVHLLAGVNGSFATK